MTTNTSLYIRRFTIWLILSLHSFTFAFSTNKVCVTTPRQTSATPSSTILFVAPTTQTWTESMGDSALRQVQTLASRVAQSTAQVEDGIAVPEKPPSPPTGNITADLTSVRYTNEEQRSNQQVWKALASLERDMQMLDTLAGEKPQLSPLEFTLLSLSVLAASLGPLLDGSIVHFLPPAAAAFSASIGIGAEFVGKVAVADGKEVAAASLQCAAEAEGLLANAERTKAVTPLCVGIGATSASFALLAPSLTSAMNIKNMQLLTELYLCCPLVSVLAAAVASLALQETKGFAQRAISVGNRRFAKSGLVGRTWLSSTEQVQSKSASQKQKWKTFSLSVLPAPLVGALVPGQLETKTIVVAALAAVQSAYFLTSAEKTIARATDAVALKSRSAAVCDTYANQGARSSAILPFTSALSGLCAAATAALVELPALDALIMKGTVGVFGSVVLVSIFPAFSSLCAAAASVSKARCQVDAQAATLAASTMALEYEESEEEDPVLRPFRGVLELIRLTLMSTVWEPLRKSTRLWRRRISNVLKKREQ